MTDIPTIRLDERPSAAGSRKAVSGQTVDHLLRDPSPSLSNIPYVVAIAILVAAIGLLLVLDGSLDNWNAVILFILPLLAAAIWGVRPVALAFIASALIASHLVGQNFPEGMDLLQFSLFLLAAGGIIALAAVLRRVRTRAEQTERVSAKVEDRAERLAQELDLFIDSASDYAIYLLDPEGQITIWNDGAERLLGWSRDEAVGKDFALLNPGAVDPYSILERARIDGHFSEEKLCRRKDGSAFPAHCSIKPLYDHEGALRGYGTVVRDMSEQRDIEHKLIDNAAHLRSILSTVPDGMIVIDDKGAILSFSAAAETIFGYSESEVAGKNVSILMPSPDRELHDGYIRRLRETGERRLIGIGRVVMAVRRDGSKFPVELSVGEAVADGSTIYTGFVRDLSERQRTEERLEELRLGLMQVSRASAMGTMASTLAHELNQPITSVKNYIDGARDILTDPHPDIADALEHASSEATRAGLILRHLREFVSRGEVEKTFESLSELVTEVLLLSSKAAREQDVDIRLHLDSTVDRVMVDRTQVQQVLINLVRNAIEALQDTDGGHVIISSAPENDHYVRVTISDDGPGIPANVTANLFRAFISTKSQGMGLGLSICRTIIEANGGRIWHEPRVPQGTTFHFTLLRGEDGSEHAG